jgi:hypothetical protein
VLSVSTNPVDASGLDEIISVPIVEELVVELLQVVQDGAWVVASDGLAETKIDMIGKILSIPGSKFWQNDT